MDDQRNEIFTCQICKHFSSITFLSVLRHVGVVHSYEPNFSVNCEMEGCNKAYSNYHSYRKHLKRKHFAVLESLPDATGTIHDDSTALSDDVYSHHLTTHDDSISLGNDNHHTESECRISNTSSNLHMHHNALLLLKYKTVHKMSQAALNNIIDDITITRESSIKSVREKVNLILQANETAIPLSLSESIQNVFKSEAEIDIFNGLDSEYLQMQYFCDSMGLVKPEEIVLRRCTVRRQMGNYSRLTQIKLSMYYVPLLKSLRQLLCNKHIYEEVQSSHQQVEGHMSDYCDGTSYKESDFFQKYPTALQIILYYDDVEICNPLGSKSKIHKLGLFYYTLGNIKPIHRSSLKSIQLLCVIKVEHLKEVGINSVLQPFVDDLKCLEQDNGVIMYINGKEETLHGTLVLASADNLASQLLGGYKTLASAVRKCRFCMAVQSDMETKFDDNEFQPRTRDTHKRHIKQLCGPLQEHSATTYGICYESVLNESCYFHITQGLVMDIMHDILEGTLMYEVKELLKYLISNGTCTLIHINNKITSFPYGYSEASNKPTVIRTDHLAASDHKLKQNASQMWCLGRLLPLMLGNIVPVESQQWKCFLQLLTIIDYVFAPVISNELVTYIKYLIKDHHEMFKELYPSCSIVPKLHYMVHISDWITRCGPLSRLWCMRFEAKHSFFKTLANRVRNFKNIPKTLATRHQQLMCYYLQDPYNSPLNKNLKTGKAEKKSVAEFEYRNAIIQKDATITDDRIIHCVRWIEIGGTVYRPNGILVIESHLTPVFGLIMQVVMMGKVPIFVCKKYVTDCYSYHFHAFEVKESSEIIAVSHEDLTDYNVLSMYKLHIDRDTIFISVKYHILENL